MLLEVQAVTQSSFAVKSLMHITNAIAATKANYEAFALEKIFFVFSLFFFVSFNSKGFNPERDAYVLFFFCECLAAARKNTNKQKSDFFCISLEWFNNAVFGKEIVVGLGPVTSRNSLSLKGNLTFISL